MTVRNWIAIHETRTAVGVAALAGVLSIATHGRTLQEFPGFSPPEHIPLELIVPAVAAIAVAAAVTTDTMSSTDRIGVRARHLVVIRLLWAHLWLVALGGALIASAALLSHGMAPEHVFMEPVQRYEAAIACNMVLMSALAVMTVALGFANGAWFPPLALMLSIVSFGGSAGGDGTHWWAKLISPDVTATRVVVAVSAWMIAVTAYALLGGYRNGRRV